MKNPCVYYHWWGYDEESCLSLRSPILPSIATLRAVSDVPIVVIDISEKSKDWMQYPERLNFTVKRSDCHLSKYKGRIDGYKHLSRIFDIKEMSDHCDVVYVDSDVFFFKDPFPLSGDTTKFCWDGWNTGFFYYNSESINLFYDIFKSYVKSAIYSTEIRQLMKNYVGYDAWYGVWDEMVVGFMKHNHKELFHTIPLEEHTTAKRFCENPKMFHSNGSMIKNPITNEIHARGIAALMIEEFWININKVLKNEDIIKIFGNDLVEYFENKRFSLVKKSRLLKSVCDSTGHYQLNELNKIDLFI